MASSSSKISRFPVPDVNSLPEDLKEKILSIQEKVGFIPNVFLALGHRPQELRAFIAYHDAVMLKEDSNLSKADREMIVVATSAENNCLYCIVSHGAILRIYAKDALISDQVAANYRKAGLSARERAMLDFAVKVATASDCIGDEDFERLAAHGFSAEDAWDIGAVASFFALSNRMASLIDMRPNDEFFSMGR